MTELRGKILSRMESLDIHAKKSLGQNFLVSDHVVEKIVAAARLAKPATLIEIGPGLGSLTDSLIALVASPKNYLAIELDREFVQFWRQQGLEVIEQDALQWSWELNKFSSPVILVSNLPYQISSSLVIDRSLDASPLDVMILMFQKEVAQRIKSKPSDSSYGFLSVMAQSFWEIDLVLEAGPRDFLPPPKVASRVLRFRSKPAEMQSKQDFLKVLKAAFVQPRKLLASNIAGQLGRDKTAVTQTLESLGHLSTVRPQQLGPREYLDLYFALGYK